MKEKFFEKVAKLIDLKSILTLLVVISLIVIIFSQIEIKDEGIRTLFISLTSSMTTYYFTRKPNTITYSGTTTPNSEG